MHWRSRVLYCGTTPMWRRARAGRGDHVDSGDADGAGSGQSAGGADSDGGAFAGAVWAEQAEEFAAADGESDVADGFYLHAAGVGLDEILDLDDVGRRQCWRFRWKSKRLPARLDWTAYCDGIGAAIPVDLQTCSTCRGVRRSKRPPFAKPAKSGAPGKDESVEPQDRWTSTRSPAGLGAAAGAMAGRWRAGA